MNNLRLIISLLLHSWVAVFAVQAPQSLAGVAMNSGVVSLDMCADQYVLAFFDPSEIKAVSPQARLSASYYRDKAKGLTQIRPSLERLLALKPQWVIRSYGGDVRLLAALRQHGIKVIELSDVESLAKARQALIDFGQAIDRHDLTASELRSFDQALKQAPRLGQGRFVLYYTPSAYSTGAKSFVGDYLQTLGFRIKAQDKGFYYISPERFLSTDTDVYALGFFEDVYVARTSPGRLPSLRKKMASKPHLNLNSAVLACPAWYSAYSFKDLS